VDYTPYAETANRTLVVFNLEELLFSTVTVFANAVIYRSSTPSTQWRNNLAGGPWTF